MSIFPKLSDVLADNPVHKLMQDLQQSVHNARTDLSSLACSLSNSPTCGTNNPPASGTVPAKPKTPPVAPSSPQNASLEVPTEEDTVIELKNRLLDQLADAEDDLEHEMKIKAGDGHLICCTCLNGKHDVKIKAKCRELMPKESDNPLYGKIITWFDTNKDKLTASACKTGQYNAEYLKMSNEIGSFRRQLQKELMGTQYDTTTVSSAKDFLKNKGV